MARIIYLAVVGSMATFLATVSAAPLFVPRPSFNITAEDLAWLNATAHAGVGTGPGPALLPREMGDKDTGDERWDPLRCPPDLPEGVYAEDLRPHDFDVKQGAMCFFTADWGPCCSTGSHPNWNTKECILKWGDPYYPERMNAREYWTTNRCDAAAHRPKPWDPAEDFDG